MKKIALVFGSILMIGGVVFLLGSNEETEGDGRAAPTEESKHFFDFRSNLSGLSVSSNSSMSETTATSSTENQIVDGHSTEERVESKSSSSAFLDVNHKLIDAYYGEWSMEERNQQLRNILKKSLHDEYLFTDDGEIFSGSIADFSYQSFHNLQEENRTTVANILEMVVDGLEQRVLITVELEFSGKWLISDLKFELIYG
jgi:hypothetical protein